VELNINFLNAAGKSLFRNITVTDYAANDTAVFDTFPVNIPADFSADGLFIRMADNGTAFTPMTENPMPGVSAAYSSEKKGNAVFHKVHFTSADNADHVFTVYYAKPLPRDGEKTPVYLQDLLHAEPIDEKKDYLDVSYWNVGANGLFAHFPFTAASCGEKGFAAGFEPTYAAFCRAGCSGSFQAIYAAADLALTPEKPETDFCFITFEFDGAKGFRGALHDYYGMFPEYYAVTIHDQGNWMAFVDISTLPDYQDFGFKFKEGNNEPAWDRQHDIYTFRYTEPMTGWMNTDRSPVNRADVFSMLAERREKNPDGIAKIVETSSMQDVNGNDFEIAMDKPWCHGAVWSINSMPGIPSPDSDFNRKWNQGLLKEWYTPGTEKELSGEYIDSCEGYVTAEISHRRDHFAYTVQPMTFSKDTWKPGIFKGAIAFEYIRAIRKDMQSIGKYTMANG